MPRLASCPPLLQNAVPCSSWQVLGTEGASAHGRHSAVTAELVAGSRDSQCSPKVAFLLVRRQVHCVFTIFHLAKRVGVGGLPLPALSRRGGVGCAWGEVAGGARPGRSERSRRRGAGGGGGGGRCPWAARRRLRQWQQERRGPVAQHFSTLHGAFFSFRCISVAGGRLCSCKVCQGVGGWAGGGGRGVSGRSGVGKHGSACRDGHPTHRGSAAPPLRGPCRCGSDRRRGGCAGEAGGSLQRGGATGVLGGMS